MLALFGVVVPYFGIEVTPVNGGVAATVGAIIGAIVAIGA
jgi:hypothetical protein